MIFASFRRAFRLPSLGRGLLVSIFAVCILILALEGWRTSTSRATEIADDKLETENLARSLAQHVHDTVQAADSVIVGVRQMVETNGFSGDEISRLRSLLVIQRENLPDIHDLFVYDANGDWIASSLAEMPKRLNNSDRAYFQFHRDNAGRAVHIDGPIRSRSDGSWIMTVTRRIDDRDGSFNGVVLATISIDSLQRFYDTFDVGALGTISLDTTGGIIVARKPHNGVITGTDISGGQIFTTFLPRSPVGSFEYVSPIDGVRRLGSYRKVENYPLVMIVAHGLDEVLASWRVNTMVQLGLSIAAVIAIGLLGLRTARQIERRQRAEHRYRVLAENSSDAILCIGLDGSRLYISPAFSAITGWSLAEALAQPWEALAHADDRREVLKVHKRLLVGEEQVTTSFRYLCKDASYRWVEARVRLVPGSGEEKAQFVANIRDISKRKQAEEQLSALNEKLAAQANTDDLTKLANRRRFDEALKHEWRRAAREAKPVSLLMIDVDRFKLYNDRYGHQQGDECLRTVAAAIAGAVQRPGDLATRYGGEEMAVILPSTDADGAAEIAERIRTAIASSGIEHEGNPPSRSITVSIGTATLWPSPDEGACPAEHLVAAADAALYEAKRTGRNRVIAAAMVPDCPVPPASVTEEARLAALARFEEKGTAAAAGVSLDRLTKLTATLFDAPIALVSLVGREHQRFAGRFGLEAEGTPREVSFCAHAIQGDTVFTVHDALNDPRFAENPLVRGEPGIRFYAGAPLIGPEGLALGALCIIDRTPRPPWRMRKGRY